MRCPAGLTPGTRVVTIGAAEVYGAELELTVGTEGTGEGV